MIKVSVLYPNTPGSRFDIDYYLKSHMPMVKRCCGAPLKNMAVERGIAGGEEGAPPPYLALGHLYFDSVDAFQKAFGPHAKEIIADIPNYTNTSPVIQISEVRM